VIRIWIGTTTVMAGLVPAIHAFAWNSQRDSAENTKLS
jgi:hypothetical protein